VHDCCAVDQKYHRVNCLDRDDCCSPPTVAQACVSSSHLGHPWHDHPCELQTE
jgi:hypothetical protein